ncbi:MAG: hypothetical protein LRZ99_05845 [Desulfotomaculum sp.]|nr:hypothetical protein [Desulfotomaculum sp.]
MIAGFIDGGIKLNGERNYFSCRRSTGRWLPKGGYQARALGHQARALGHQARALGHSIFTEADTWAGLKAAVRDAVLCHFDNREQRFCLYEIE